MYTTNIHLQVLNLEFFFLQDLLPYQVYRTLLYYLTHSERLILYKEEWEEIKKYPHPLLTSFRKRESKHKNR